jgi:hypothetical protein
MRADRSLMHRYCVKYFGLDGTAGWVHTGNIHLSEITPCCDCGWSSRTTFADDELGRAAAYEAWAWVHRQMMA